jgi:hypothetical protein
MKTASGLILTAVGAILAFAVTAHPSWFNIQVAGWVIMVVGIAGIFVPRKAAGWRRRLITSWAPGGPVRDRSGRAYPPPRPSIEGVRRGDTVVDTGPVDRAEPVTVGDPPVARETVEEFIEE